MATRTACIIGWPVGHSRSPVIHRFWLRQLGIAGDYVIAPVEPGKIGEYLADFEKTGFVGGNVTIPHKEAAFAAVAEMDAAARAIGAVNTIWLDDGRLLGANTDAHGFLANLDQEAPGWDAEPGEAVVLGAGGSARAVVWALSERAFAPIHVVNRTAARAEALAERFGSGIRPAGWENVSYLMKSAKILVNTTSLGMENQPPLPVDLSSANQSLLVTDIVYVPLMTPVLVAARTRGLRTVDGLGMLLHQAAPGFARWFGAPPEVSPELREAVLATMRTP